MRLVLVRITLALMLVVMAVPASVASADPPLPTSCQRYTQSTGAIGLICVPAQGWNGDLVVYAHGYVSVDKPLDLQHLTLPDGTFLPTLLMQLGFAFATSSYRQNGLAILEGADDLRALTRDFYARVRRPRHTYITGVSEGGLVATKLVEQSPEMFDGGLATCGPIGDFRGQVDYLGDFRVLFDYYFPGVLPGSPIAIPPALIAGWTSTYLPAVDRALAANPTAAQQLIAASHASIDGADPTSTQQTVEHLLWYSVFTTNDAVAKLGGNPYDNSTRIYLGSADDWTLNLRVPRFRAEPRARAAMESYQTSGAVTIPFVTLHTTADEIVPFWHELAYAAKVRTSGRGMWTPLPVFRYGHCNFNVVDVLAGFGLLVWQVTGQESAATAHRARP